MKLGFTSNWSQYNQIGPTAPDFLDSARQRNRLAVKWLIFLLIHLNKQISIRVACTNRWQLSMNQIFIIVFSVNGQDSLGSTTTQALLIPLFIISILFMGNCIDQLVILGSYSQIMFRYWNDHLYNIFLSLLHLSLQFGILPFSITYKEIV